MTVRIRYKRADGDRVIEEDERLNTFAFHSLMVQTSPAFKLAVSVAQYAELLRHAYWAKDDRIGDLRGLAREASLGFVGDPNVAEFTTLLEKAASLAPPRR